MVLDKCLLFLFRCCFLPFSGGLAKSLVVLLFFRLLFVKVCVLLSLCWFQRVV